MELRRALFVHNPARPAAAVAVERGLTWCSRHGVSAALHAEGTPVAGTTDLVVAIGGDGTVLRAAGLICPQEIPLFAVSAGGLGFLAACDGAEIEAGLAEVAEGKARLERRMRLRARGSGVDLTALNDAVVVGPDGQRFTGLDVALDGEGALTIDGDGLVVATPTGSTAYALAAGGPLLLPAVAALVLVPLAPHRLGARPLVAPEGSEILVRARYPAQLLLDGEAVGALPAGEEVRIERACGVTTLARLGRTESFFSRLQAKLGLSG